MNKQTYLAKLAQLLAPLPEQERQDALNYYEEYFDAAGPEAEDATAAELGDPADAARKIFGGRGPDSGLRPSRSRGEQRRCRHRAGCCPPTNWRKSPNYQA